MWAGSGVEMAARRRWKSELSSRMKLSNAQTNGDSRSRIPTSTNEKNVTMRMHALCTLIAYEHMMLIDGIVWMRV